MIADSVSGNHRAGKNMRLTDTESWAFQNDANSASYFPGKSQLTPKLTLRDEDC